MKLNPEGTAHADECDCRLCQEIPIIKDETRVRDSFEILREEIINHSITEVDRLEIIEPGRGRSFIRAECQITTSLQDDGKTLKIFVERREEK